METADIEIENILPQPCLDAPDVEAFMTELEKADAHFEKLRAEAEANGKVLRLIATLEGEKAFINLQQVDEQSPFYNLSGSDNMIVFSTERYKERPLVIKGPGAGAAVTAAGVFAEILRDWLLSILEQTVQFRFDFVDDQSQVIGIVDVV